jgi:membrane fusion protein, multidrug efflux system
MNRSYVIAGGILGLICVYMLVGMPGCGGTDAIDSSALDLDDSLGKAVMTVRVETLESVEIAREVVVRGRTDAARRVTVRAETGGRVETIDAPRGAPVAAGEPLLRLAVETRRESLARAESELEVRRIELQAADRLAAQNLTSDSALAAMRAGVTAAEEAVAAARFDLEQTTLRAPFAGVLSDRMVEVGDYLQRGDPVATFLELDPLIIRGEVTELEVGHVRPGEHGLARLADGHEVEGWIRFVDTDADPATRTFTVELEVSNPDGAIPAGKTAEIIIETELVPAFEISAAHVSIDDEGHFGIKYVDEDDIVRFAPVDIVRSTPRTLWLTGLPPKVRLITVGQGFTKPGDPVKVVAAAVERE